MSESDQTSRWGLPLLAVGQMQKEVTHNEALTLLDALLVPIVEAAPQNTPPGAPVAGQCWLVGPAPVGPWSGRAGQIACWTSGGWRWVNPRKPMAVRINDGRVAIFDGTIWALPPSILAPSGGSTVDSEARATLNAIIFALRASGWLEPFP